MNVTEGGTYRVWCVVPNDGTPLRDLAGLLQQAYDSRGIDGTFTLSHWGPDVRVVFYRDYGADQSVVEPTRLTEKAAMAQLLRELSPQPDDPEFVRRVAAALDPSHTRKAESNPIRGVTTMYRCPVCKNKVSLSVTISVEASLCQDHGNNLQTELMEEDHSWDGDSLMTCGDCSHCDSSRNFELPQIEPVEFSVTYCETDPESSDSGDWSDTGFEHESYICDDFSEVVSLAKKYGDAYDAGRCLSSGWETTDYRTGTERQTSVHPANDRARKYLAKAAAHLGIK